jgi:hypothetical protein
VKYWPGGYRDREPNLSAGIPATASATIEPDIFDSPVVLSRKTIGTSTTFRPACASLMLGKRSECPDRCGYPDPR